MLDVLGVQINSVYFLKISLAIICYLGIEDDLKR